MKSRNKFLSLASATVAFATAFTAQAVQADPGEFHDLANSLNNDTLTAVTSTLTDNYVYAQEQNGTTFYRYNRDTNSWTTLASSPISGTYAGAAYANGDIYTAYANNDLTLGVYDIATDTWTQVTNPLGTGSGTGTTNIASDNIDTIYLLNGTQFVQYTASTNTTLSRASAPFAVSDLGGLEVYNGYVYALEGGGLNRFARYNISTNTWQTLPDVPSTGAVAGSVIDTENGLLYAYGDAGDNNLYIYNIANNTWTTVDIPLFNVSNGGLAYLPYYDEVVFVQGEAGTEFGSFETIPLSSYYYGSFYQASLYNPGRPYGVIGTGTVGGYSYGNEVDIAAPNGYHTVKTSFSATYTNGKLSGVVNWTDNAENVQLTSVQLIGVTPVGYQEFEIYGTATINGGSTRYAFTLYAQDARPFYFNSGDDVALSIPGYPYYFEGEYTQGDNRVTPSNFSYYNGNPDTFKRN